MKKTDIARQRIDKTVKQEQYQPDRESSLKMNALDQLDPTDTAALAQVGVLTEGEQRAGTLILRDFCPICIPNQTEGLELLPIATALEKYDWLREKYFWKAVPADLDEITEQCASQQEVYGYFAWVRKGAKVLLPCQAALYMASDNITQVVHNVVIVEDDAELQLVTGCVTHQNVYSGLHMAVSEQFIGKNARLINTMVHDWGPDVTVYPRSGTFVEAGGRYESNYISLRPAKIITSNPQTRLIGKGASAKFLSVILGVEGSMIDMGGDIYLDADDTTAELAHRGVCTGGKMHQKGLLIGNAKCKAHVDCAGLLLNVGEEGFILSIPGIKAHHPDARMSHEASIGKLAPEQVEYLQSRGMEEREAISLMIRGFLGADIDGLGFELEDRIAEITELAGHGEG